MIKFYPHLFFNPVSKKMSTPPPRLSTPHLKKNVDPPTSFWTIRTLGLCCRRIHYKPSTNANGILPVRFRIRLLSPMNAPVWVHRPIVIHWAFLFNFYLGPPCTLSW